MTRNLSALAGRISAAAFLLLASLPLEAAGEGWKRRGLERRVVPGVVVDPNDARSLSAVVANTATETFTSANGGLSWTGRGTDPRFLATSLASPTDGSGDLYVVDLFDNRVGVEQGSFFRSVDHGQTWTSLKRAAFSVFADPVEKGRVWIGGANGIENSSDRGATWSGALVSGDCPIISLARSQSAPSILYSGTGRSPFDYCQGPIVYKSTDSGKSWSGTPGKLPAYFVWALEVDPSDPGRVLAGTSEGLFVSEDAGETWSLRLGVETLALAIEARAGAVIYAGTSELGVLRSVDHGRTWYEFNAGLQSPYVKSLALAPGGKSLYAGTDDGVFASELPGGPLDLSIATDGTTRFASFDTSTRRLVLGSVGLDRQAEPGLSRGPYAGWTPLAQADGGDGATRLLWTHADGSAALWLTDPGGVRASYLYPPGFGLTAADVAAGPGSDTHILWTDTDGTAFLGTIDGSGAVARSVTVGPYPGWTPVAIADGPDGMTRLLWNSRDGRVGLSQVSSDGMLGTARSDSEAGWTAIDVAVGGDGRARILRSHEDGRYALRIVDAAGETPVDYPAPAGMTASRIAAGPDGSSRVLFTDPRGSGALVFLSPGGAYEDLIPLTP